MKPELRSIIRRAGEFLKNNSRLIVSSVVLSLISFPKFNLIYSYGIDPSLFWVFNYFADGHYDQAKDVIFPHGPLAFLLYPVAMGNNVVAAILFYAVLHFLFCFAFLEFREAHGQNSFYLNCIVALLLLAVGDLQLVLIFTVLLLFLIAQHKPNKSTAVLAIALSVVALFIKSYGGMICLLLLLSETIRLAITNKLVQALSIPLIFGGLYFLARIVLFQSLDGSVDFLRGQFELSLNNSEAVSYYRQNNWWLVGGCLITIASIPFISGEKPVTDFFVFMLLPLFGAWKHAMARGEENHMGGFLNFLIFFLILLWVQINRRQGYLVLSGLLSLSLFQLNLSFRHGVVSDKQIALFRPFNLYNQIANYDSIAEHKRQEINYYLRNHHLSDSVLHLIDGASVDVFPWDYGYVPANRLNWEPRPVLQSYSSYSSWLDGKNAAYFRSGSGAKYYIWHLSDADENFRTFESIDSRYILNDQPETNLEFFRRYKLILKVDGYLLYEKRKTAFPDFERTTSARSKIEFNRWINVSLNNGNSITRAKVRFSKSISGHFKSLLYKGELIYVYYELEDGRIYCHRVAPGNSADGLWIDPFILSPESTFREPRVKRIRFSCSDPDMLDDKLEISFEYLRIPDNDTIDFASLLFGKTDFDSTSLTLVNRAEEIAGHETYQENSGIGKSSKYNLAGALSYRLKPGQTSGRFVVQPDSSKLAGAGEFPRFYFEGFVRSSREVVASFVCKHRNKDGKDMIWKKEVAALKDLVDDELNWTYIYLVVEIPPVLINYREPFYFYAENLEGSPADIYLDNLSVRVEYLKKSF